MNLFVCKSFDYEPQRVLLHMQDQVVRDARGVGGQSDNMNDFNPFSTDQTSTKVCKAVLNIWHI